MDWLKSLTGFGAPNSSGGTFENYGNWNNMAQLNTADPLGGFMVKQGILNTPENMQGGFLSGMVGTKDAPGWGGMALGAAQGLGNAFMGMKQYGLAKKTLKENKRQFQENFNAQKKTTNASLEDRQRARVAANSGGYESVGDYMNKYRI